MGAETPIGFATGCAYAGRVPDIPASQPHPTTHATAASRLSGLDWAVRIGTAMIAVGALATVVTLLPLFTGLDPMPLGVYLLCFLAPLGFGVILMALWQRARTRRHRLRDTTESR